MSGYLGGTPRPGWILAQLLPLWGGSQFPTRESRRFEHEPWFSNSGEGTSMNTWSAPETPSEQHGGPGDARGRPDAGVPWPHTGIQILTGTWKTHFFL